MHSKKKSSSAFYQNFDLSLDIDYETRFYTKNSRSIAQIVFESEHTSLVNTLKDYSFPYKLQGLSNNPPMSHLLDNINKNDKLKRFRRLFRKLDNTELIYNINKDTTIVHYQFENKKHHNNEKELIEENKDKEIYKSTINEQLNVNIKFNSESQNNVLENITLPIEADESEIFNMRNVNIRLSSESNINLSENMNHLEEVSEIRFANKIDNKENIIGILIEKQNLSVYYDKDKNKLLENIFYPYKTMDNPEFKSMANNTLLLYQIKKEEVEKILNLTQSIEEQDNFIPEKVENKTGKYSSEHLCEISNVDQRPIKKVFMVFPKKNDFRIDLNIIQEGRDKRTTCMIKNIPNKYSQSMIVNMLDEHHKNQYDFVYLRMDFKNKCNVGYAFVNFIDCKVIPSFYCKINGKGWVKYKSNKIAELTYASIQGIENLIKKFKKSNIMWEIQEYRPKVYYRDGPLKGMEWDVMNED